ncbi:immunoglobulin superfamily containing leucine-rich repeat protein 2 isoform X3 [Zalophus californianus]|uniref:immunoglobulin superfamily containing leucine-rich repeat protein 2 isoform X3 n=1 Tax=Zalophus californianus TaxID=9704 RepID=UPI000F8009F6|nr:immunoglobulin superfamily containing leucine-rich repeat protein 2 isoform X3 [Zalophus californianus]
MMPLWALWLAWALLGVAGACPEPCACVDKYAHQFADCAYKELREVPEGLPANVTTLSLSANKITVLRRGAFADVTQVTSLWLAHNEVRTVEPGALAVLSQLKNLDLSHNLISSFPWSDLRNLSALQLLKMNHNRLGSLPRDALGALPDLRSLRINNNRLRTLAPGTFDALSALSHLQLYHNPFHCGCSLVWLQAWAASTRVSLPEPDSIACASPPALQGVPVHRLPALSCVPPSVRLSAEPPPEAPGSPWPAGLALRLHCVAEGHPTPRLQWRLQIPGGTIVLEPPVLSGEDNGDGAEDGEEEGDGTGPTQTEAPTPTPAPAWPAPPANPRFLALTNGSLLVPLLSAKEAGVYTCRAHNELGANSTSLRVAVAAAGPPKHAPGAGGDSEGQVPTSERKFTAKGRGNSVLPSKPEGKIKGQGLARVSALGETEAGPEEEEEAGEGEEAEDQVSADPVKEQHCGHGDPSRPLTPWRNASPPTSTRVPPTSSPRKATRQAARQTSWSQRRLPGRASTKTRSRGTQVGTCRGRRVWRPAHWRSPSPRPTKRSLRRDLSTVIDCPWAPRRSTSPRKLMAITGRRQAEPPARLARPFPSPTLGAWEQKPRAGRTYAHHPTRNLHLLRPFTSPNLHYWGLPEGSGMTAPVPGHPLSSLSLWAQFPSTASTVTRSSLSL